MAKKELTLDERIKDLRQQQEEAKALHVSNVGPYVHARRILHSIHVVP